MASNEKPRQRFQYHNLPEGHIRLVRIFDSHSTNSLTIDVIAQPIEGAQYETLSYRWGDPSDGTQEVACIDGTFITVTQNLKDALEATRESGGALLWIDQIAINQENAVERGVQVKMMGQIYSHCSRMRVWLSQKIWEDATLIDFLPALSELTVKYLKYKTGQSTNEDSKALRQMLEAIPKNVWTSFIALIEQEYWTRVWIVQEIIKSPTTVVLVGHRGILWKNSLQQILYIVDHEFFDDRFHSTLRFYTRAITKISTLQTRLRSVGLEFIFPARWQTKKWTLLDLLLKLWNFGATDPRDKVYAVLSLLEFSSQVVHEEVEVDYSLTLETILLERFAQGMTRTVNPTLEPLYYTHPHSPRGWPSWIPPVNGHLAWPCEIGYHGDKCSAGGIGDPGCRKVSGSPNKLQIPTRHIGSVSAIAHFEGTTVQQKIEMANQAWSLDVHAEKMQEERDWFATRFHEAYKLYLAHFTGEKKTKEDALEFLKAFACDLNASESHRLSDLDLVVLQACADVLWRTKDAHIMEEANEVTELVIPALFTEYYRRSKELQFCVLDQAAVNDTAPPRNYPLMGWMQQGVQVGDEVHVIRGFPFPMLIRREDAETYRLAGVCFLHEYMAGEAYTESRPDLLITVV